MDKLLRLAIDLAIVLFVIVSVWWSGTKSHNAETLNPDRTWVVDLKCQLPQTSCPRERFLEPNGKLSRSFFPAFCLLSLDKAQRKKSDPNNSAILAPDPR